MVNVPTGNDSSKMIKNSIGSKLISTNGDIKIRLKLIFLFDLLLYYILCNMIKSILCLTVKINVSSSNCKVLPLLYFNFKGIGRISKITKCFKSLDLSVQFYYNFHHNDRLGKSKRKNKVKHKVDIESIFISTCKGSLFSKKSIQIATSSNFSSIFHPKFHPSQS